MSDQRLWLCNLPREASCRLRSFWYACWRNMKTISGTMSLDLEFDLPGKMPGQKSHACVNFPVALAVAWDHFGTSADVIYERYPVPLLSTLYLTFKMSLKIKMKALFVFCVQNLPGKEVWRTPIRRGATLSVHHALHWILPASMTVQACRPADESC